MRDGSIDNFYCQGVQDLSRRRLRLQLGQFVARGPPPCAGSDFVISHRFPFPARDETGQRAPRANAIRRSRSPLPTRRARGHEFDIGPMVAEVVITAGAAGWPRRWLS